MIEQNKIAPIFVVAAISRKQEAEVVVRMVRVERWLRLTTAPRRLLQSTRGFEVPKTQTRLPKTKNPVAMRTKTLQKNPLLGNATENLPRLASI
jgi:hypothetical protein